MHEGERFNSITHLVGASLAAAGTSLLVALAALQGDPWKIVSFSVYGATLLTLYLVSTLYHSLRGRARAVFRVLDHAAIYLLIAGTYTPFSLVALRGAWGWSLFGVVWGLAIFGIVVDSLPRKGRRILPIALYVLMGWLGILALRPLIRALPVGAMIWLLAGGLFYTAGISFYLASKRLRHAHGVWHLFVLAGSITHYIAILLYLV